MKNKEWLKNEISENCVKINGDKVIYLNRLNPLIDKLDDQSRQIDKLANFIMSEVEGEPSQSQSAVDTAIRIIKSYEPQKVVVPKWFDEWVKKNITPESRTYSRLYELFSDELAMELTREQNDWIESHIEEAIRAILDGYEVEKEKLYWVRNK